jgi:predicted NAD-dependent protein-ADP-ribosyltransferase YbiA (DUF1768 family)
MAIILNPTTSYVGPIIRFKSRLNNEYSFLSKFWPFVDHPAIAQTKFGLPLYASFTYKGQKYLTSEHFFQFHKFLVIDPLYAPIILQALDAKQAKILSGKEKYCEWKAQQSPAKKVSIKQAFDRLKSIFEAKQDDVMKTAIFCKFTQIDELKLALLATGNAKMQEQGRKKRDYWAHTGNDRLGQLLMELREMLKAWHI